MIIIRHKITLPSFDFQNYRYYKYFNWQSKQCGTCACIISSFCYIEIREFDARMVLNIA